jgi:putative ATP-binding cassette transporter
MNTVTPLREPVSRASAFRQLWEAAGPYWWSRDARPAWLAGAGLVMVTLGHAFIQLHLNLWLGDFFNALDAHAGAHLWRDLGVFVLLALGLMATAAAQIHLKMSLQAGWRAWLTERLIGRWLDHGHAYVLRFRDAEYDNPDYRIAEDVRMVIEATIDFAVGLVNSALLLVLFLGILWRLSEGAAGDSVIAVPGYLVFAALVYALLTTGLTHLFGQRLVAFSGDLHAREGDFRYNLVRVRDNAEGIALSRGEADERRGLGQIFKRLIEAWRRLVGLQTRLAWLTSGFAVATPVVPLLIAAPQYIGGTITLGGLMQASQAFIQVQLALGFVVDNYSRISDWVSGIHRIFQFDSAIAEIERNTIDPGEQHIVVKPSSDGHLRFADLTVDSPDGTVVIDSATSAIAPGERVLVVGQSGVGKTTLFRAIAGLWPWGSGTIEVPASDQIMFMPHRAYLPPGPLRAVVAYPRPAHQFDDAALRAALERTGLGHYVDRLDSDSRWQDVMTEEEQQRLAFARLLLQRPSWVLMDEATSELDDGAEADLMSLFTKELSRTTLISIGQRKSLAAYHGKTLTLTASETGSRLVRGGSRPPERSTEGFIRRALRGLIGTTGPIHD